MRYGVRLNILKVKVRGDNTLYLVPMLASKITQYTIIHSTRLYTVDSTRLYTVHDYTQYHTRRNQIIEDGNCNHKSTESLPLVTARDIILATLANMPPAPWPVM